MTDDPTPEQLTELRTRTTELEQQLEQLRTELSGVRGRLDLSMRGQLRCPACGCRRIFRSRQVLDRSDSGRKPLSLVQPSIWSSRGVGEFEAYVCSACGLVEWYISDPDRVAENSEHFEVLDGPGESGPYR